MGFIATAVKDDIRFEEGADFIGYGRKDDGTTWALDWTPENMLPTAVGSNNTDLRYVYDADGMMVQRLENEGENGEQVTVFLGKLFEHNLTFDSYRKQYLFNGRLVAAREGLAANDTMNYYLTDVLGSIATTLYADGSVKAEKRYKPFGEERYTSGITPTGQRFTGQRWDDGLGLYDYNSRYYDPYLNRFLSADTIVPDPTNPQSFNRYSYALNQPLIYRDPSGHSPCDLVCPEDNILPGHYNWGGAHGGSWDIQQQRQNSQNAEAILQETRNTVAGLFWEPADWGVALSDGFQWYDSVGMLPLIPAVAGRWIDDATSFVGRHFDEVDLFAFGSLDGPRPPRAGRDIFPDPSGIIPAQSLPLPNGASTYADVNQAPLTGQYHRLPAGTNLPEGLAVTADGMDVIPNSPHPATHHTIFNTIDMSIERFTELFNSLPWEHAGKRK